MSKLYKVDLNLQTKELTPHSGLLMMNVDKEVDPRGFRERTGAEVFQMIADAAINGANPKVSHDQLKNFRRISKDIEKSIATGSYIANKTDIDIVKNSLKGHTGWPNTDEMLAVLDDAIDRLSKAEEVNEAQV